MSSPPFIEDDGVTSPHPSRPVTPENQAKPTALTQPTVFGFSVRSQPSRPVTPEHRPNQAKSIPIPMAKPPRFGLSVDSQSPRAVTPENRPNATHSKTARLDPPEKKSNHKIHRHYLNSPLPSQAGRDLTLSESMGKLFPFLHRECSNAARPYSATQVANDGAAYKCFSSVDDGGINSQTIATCRGPGCGLNDG